MFIFKSAQDFNQKSKSNESFIASIDISDEETSLKDLNKSITSSDPKEEFDVPQKNQNNSNN